MTTNENSIEERWRDIDWKEVECQVYRIQKRIYKASLNGNTKLVHRLQRLLTHSYYAKLLAVRRVSQDNQGKKTAGVDGIKSLTSKQRLELVKNLKLGNKGKPTRRVWIPKPNGEKRPLGIPTMKDRALQALVKQALEPQWEAKFEPNSYGFRPGRSCHDAIDAIFTAIRYKSKFVLDADIAKCFDKINHEKLLTKLETYPELRQQIKAWLKCGVIDNGDLFPTDEGTPQGGVISPLLANIALHGMEEKVKEYARKLKGDKRKNETALSLIRYADDFLILHKDLKVIENCKEIIQTWLSELGLELKPSKTRISHTLNDHNGNIGFNFLGFTIRQFLVGKNQSGKHKGKLLGFKTIIKPSKEKVKLHIQKLNEVTRSHKTTPQDALIKHLNPIIRGWCNYYSTVVSKKEFSRCDNTLYNQLRRWAYQKHPNKNNQWRVNKYWHTKGTKNWVFSNKDGKNKLLTHAETPILRHIKVQGNRSIYDGDLTYWSSRMGKHPEMPLDKAYLLKRQKGQCLYCELKFKDGDLLEIDHIIPTSSGGNNSYKNKQLIHRHCHDKKTASDGNLSCSG